MEKKDIKSMSLEELTETVQGLGEKPFRGKQLYEWMHKKLADDFDEMTNLPKDFREKLKKDTTLTALKILEVQVSKIDGTRKYLFALEDGNVVESVLMRYHHGNSVCISSQVGCRMGCAFCASTLTGLTRSLTAGEMLSQIYEIQKETGERVSNVIVMGMGEPLDNYDNLIRFIKLLSHPQGIQISQRSITVSTCGLVDRIRDLMKEKFQITLAISLHAPNDEIRQKTMPIAKKYSMDEIFSACQEYVNVTGRRVTFEYSMIAGVNDGKAHALELARRCRGLNCHINLIPLNEVKERKCHRSKEENIRDFKLVLEENRINVTIRREMGSDIDAACGQLRNQFMNRLTSE